MFSFSLFFKAIRQHSPCQPCLVFVSSRRQTRLTALDLIAFLAAEDNPKQWMHLEENDLEQLLSGITDNNLKLCLAFGNFLFSFIYLFFSFNVLFIYNLIF